MDGEWRTINGVHVLIGKDGSILKGPKALQKSDIQKRLKKQFKGKEEPKGFEDSKIRDKEGKLLKVYHGTDADFNEFDIEKSGTKGQDAYGKGAYFTPDKKVADRFGAKTKEAYLNIKKPFIIQTEEQLEKVVEFKKEAFEKKIDVSKVFKSKGYDGVISYEDIGSTVIHEIVVFDKEQIKILK